jgi:hypothetical protein
VVDVVPALNVADGTVAGVVVTLPGGVVSITPSGGRIFTIAGITLVALQPTSAASAAALRRKPTG